MKVSIVIPTYNEENLILDCLKSLNYQTFKDFEVVLVDDGSTDSTLNILEKYKSSFTYSIKVFHQDHLGPGYARNYGVTKATGEIIVFLDADMTFDMQFLAKLTEPILNGSAKGTFSKEEYVSNWDNVWARCLNVDKGWEIKKRHPKKYPDKQKVFRAILKSEFEKVNGFDARRGYDDDWSLSEKLKYEAIVAPEAIFYHANPDTLIEVFMQSRWEAKRKYKLGIVGEILSLLRVSFPESVWIGVTRGLFKKEPLFVIYKIVADFGAFIGLLEKILFKKFTK